MRHRPNIISNPSTRTTVASFIYFSFSLTDFHTHTNHWHYVSEENRYLTTDKTYQSID